MPDPTVVCAGTCDDRGAVTLFLPSNGNGKPQARSAEEDVGTTDSDADSRVRAADSALDEVIASMAALSKQVQTGTLTFSDTVCGVTVSLDGVYSMPRIERGRYDPVRLYDEPQKLSSVLGLLGLREGEADNYYTDGAGDRIYLNASGRLTVSNTASVIRYVALQEGGLDPADYLGYASIGQDYLLSEYLRASDKLLSLLSAADPMFGGDALSCTLTDVELSSTADADTLVLTWGYTYRGIPLLDDGGVILPAMVLRASGGVITELELYLCDAVLSEEEQYLLPQSVMAEAMALELSQNSAAQPEADLPDGAVELTAAEIPLSMAYLCDSHDSWGSYSAVWIGMQ